MRDCVLDLVLGDAGFERGGVELGVALDLSLLRCWTWFFPYLFCFFFWFGRLLVVVGVVNKHLSSCNFFFKS